MYTTDPYLGGSGDKIDCVATNTYGQHGVVILHHSSRTLSPAQYLLKIWRLRKQDMVAPSPRACVGNSTLHPRRTTHRRAYKRLGCRSLQAYFLAESWISPTVIAHLVVRLRVCVKLFQDGHGRHSIQALTIFCPF